MIVCIECQSDRFRLIGPVFIAIPPLARCIVRCEINYRRHRRLSCLRYHTAAGRNRAAARRMDIHCKECSPYGGVAGRSPHSDPEVHITDSSYIGVGIECKMIAITHRKIGVTAYLNIGILFAGVEHTNAGFYDLIGMQCCPLAFGLVVICFSIVCWQPVWVDGDICDLWRLQLLKELTVYILTPAEPLIPIAHHRPPSSTALTELRL